MWRASHVRFTTQWKTDEICGNILNENEGGGTLKLRLDDRTWPSYHDSGGGQPALYSCVRVIGPGQVLMNKKNIYMHTWPYEPRVIMKYLRGRDDFWTSCRHFVAQILFWIQWRHNDCFQGGGSSYNVTRKCSVPLLQMGHPVCWPKVMGNCGRPSGTPSSRREVYH